MTVFVTIGADRWIRRYENKKLTHKFQASIEVYPRIDAADIEFVRTTPPEAWRAK